MMKWEMMMLTKGTLLRWAIVVGLLSTHFGSSLSATLAQVQNLHTTLFTGYNRDLLPVLNQSETAYVGVSLYIISLNDFNQISGVISTSMSFSFSWTDERLVWDKTTYGGKSYIYAAPEVVWKPQIYPLQLAEKIEEIGNISLMTVIQYDGSVSWSPGMVVKSTCSVDVTYFPFDEQNCLLDLSPGAIFASDLILHSTNERLFTNYLTENSEWDILATSSFINYTRFSDDVQKYVRLQLRLKRRSTFYEVYIVWPLIFLSLLNNCVFLMPSNSGERLSVAVTMFLSFIVYMGIVNDNVPSSSSPMAIMYFYLLFLMIYSTCIMILCIVSLRVYERDTNVPKMIKQLIKYLRFRCFKKKTARVEMEANRHDEKENNTDEIDKTHIKDTNQANDDNGTSIKMITWKLVGKTFDIYCFVCMNAINCIVSVMIYSILKNGST